MPIEQSLLDRGALGLPADLLVPQMGGLLAQERGTDPVSKPYHNPPIGEVVARSRFPSSASGAPTPVSRETRAAAAQSPHRNQPGR
jgi:hypothetical protein